MKYYPEYAQLAQETADDKNIFIKSEQTGFLITLIGVRQRPCGKNMKNKTPEQKQMEREYKRQQSIIKHSHKGQSLIRPHADGTDYTARQYADYAKYQGFIDRAKTRMRKLEGAARSLSACVNCSHPPRSHQRFSDDSGCYHTMGCVCTSFINQGM